MPEKPTTFWTGRFWCNSLHNPSAFHRNKLECFNWYCWIDAGRRVSNEKLNSIIQLLLDNCTRVTELDSLEPTITETDMKRKYTRWKESTTTTSPSGRHLGHWKSLWKHPCHDLDDKGKEHFYIAEQQLQTLYVNMINYAVKHRYHSYQRWKQIVNNMIYKEKGHQKVHRLRVIHIYESDLNFLLDLKWKAGLHHGMKMGHICMKDNTDLYQGSKLRQFAYWRSYNWITLCSQELHTVILILIWQAVRTESFSPSVAWLQGGWTYTETLCLYKLQHLMKLNLNTNWKLEQKISKTSYKHCTKLPIYGSGQGSSSSPSLWAFISSKLFQC